MIKKALVFMFLLIPMTVHADALIEEFEDFAVAESSDSDITMKMVELNDGADPVAVGGFDIAGIMLGMPFEDIQALFYKSKGLYVPRKNNSIIYTIHPDWKYNLDYECRQQGTVIPSDLANCIKTLARSRGLLYASEVHLERPQTGETITVYLTSNASDNLVYRVVYNNDVNEIEGAGEKFEKQWENKVLAFWQSVLDKYGAPNAGSDMWISSTNSYDPMMMAYYGALELIDKGRQASDLAKNIQQARENFKAKPYAF